jgi:hypothetical protein
MEGSDMVDVASLVEVPSLTDLIYKDGLGLAVDLMKDLFKAAFIGGSLLVVNLFAKERREQQKLNRIKSYEVILKLKDVVTAAGGSLGVLRTEYLADRISALEDIMDLTPPSYGLLDKICYDLFSVVAALCIIALFFIVFSISSEVGNLRWVIAFIVALIIVLLVCIQIIRLGYAQSTLITIFFV